MQAIDLEKLLKHEICGDQGSKKTKQGNDVSPVGDFEKGGNLTLGISSTGPRPTEGEQCSMIPPGLHGRFPVTLTDIPRCASCCDFGIKIYFALSAWTTWPLNFQN